jgi:hypothetical protein
MSDKAEEGAKVWQVDSVKERQVAQERVIERLDARISDYAKNQVTTPQLEERLRSVTSSFEDKLSAKGQKHDADIREINLKYGPLADNYKWITRGVLMLIIAQLIALAFNFFGGNR